MSFRDDGLPKPLVLLGPNGSGKTNLLSILADALIEGASAHHDDVVPRGPGLQRPWLRIAGGSTITAGEAGAFSIVVFDAGEDHIFFTEKSGTLQDSEAQAETASDLHPQITWPTEGVVKSSTISESQSRSIYASGVYAYYPASRSEVPHWLNVDSVQPRFDTATHFTGKLNRAIYTERSLDSIRQWLLGLLLDSRSDFVDVPALNQVLLTSDLARARLGQNVWRTMNEILRIVTDDPGARFVWTGRHVAMKLGFETTGAPASLALEALSSGQSNLLSVFGSILRLADLSALEPSEVEGICLVDEIDSHLHVELQYKAIARLISLFPRVQFVISCHSPLAILGLERHFGTDVTLLELPRGTSVDAEAYSDFGTALDVMRNTKAFDKMLAEDLAREGPELQVALEGETDPRYLEAAMVALQRADLLGRIKLHWIGDRDPSSGQARNTGASALESMIKFYRSNPDLLQGPILALFDNDQKKAAIDEGLLHIRTLPDNPRNAIVRAGIENLLPSSVFEESMYDTTSRTHPNGREVTTRELNKTRLCTSLCEDPRPEIFEGFRNAITLIEDLAPPFISPDLQYDDSRKNPN